jgi:hypothetical protein
MNTHTSALLTIFLYEQLDQVVKQVEKDLLDCITQALLSVTITINEAKKTVSDFFKSFPIRNMKELVEKLYMLCTTYPYCLPVYCTYGKEYDEHMRMQKTAFITDHIKQNNIDIAYQGLKGGIVW